jgi:hypothetical protein
MDGAKKSTAKEKMLWSRSPVIAVFQLRYTETTAAEWFFRDEKAT